MDSAIGKGQILSRIDRWDPPAFIFLLHGLALVLLDRTDAPLWISLLAGAMAVVRLTAAWFSTRGMVRFVAAIASTLIAYAVVIADGGLESPFFFWILILLGWQAVTFNRRQIVWLGGASVAGYIATLLVTGDSTPESLARLGLLIAFIFALVVGRTILDRQEAQVRRLDDMVTTLIEDATMAVAVLDADRESVLYANPAAHRMGLTTHDSMARLILDDTRHLQKVTTLADLIVGAGYQSAPMRAFRPIGSPTSEYQIGYHPRREEGVSPVMLVYGVEIHERPAVS
jgi:PAS domain-containing protein